MPTFTQLQQKAEFLPMKLCNSYTKLYTMGGLFCSCLPFTPSQLLQDAYLIQKVAKNLNYYAVVEENKLLVLQGVYLYIWERYDSSFQKVFNKPFLDTLSAHLEVNSLEELNKDTYEDSYQALDEFCNWVYHNRFHRELGELYRAFPNDMQANIHTRSYRVPESDLSSWGGTITSLLKGIGINKLF
ncbi:hypothetical protein ACNVED_10025 [Legionella sp. D16C41]|uniref:hypothetical protein n=1 Tax=Legionella sp. D16C41 TaxID=3402688 RepID=UPI003AF7F060